jgi:hypothetical protein
MWPLPDDSATIRRMRAAHATARNLMSVDGHDDQREIWGWHGRTLSQAVTATTGPGWLRLAAALAGHADPVFWNGSIEAQAVMPASVLRPQLRRWHDWHDESWQYRAELYDYCTAKPVSTTPVLVSQPKLPARWWTAARAALNDITTVRTSRHTITRQYLEKTMPRFLGNPIDPDPPVPWTTAHGDFHFANITAPDLQILDFEGWGLAPAGYDAATLHSYSLLDPTTAARIRRELSRNLDTPAGRHAELVAITELLHASTRGEHAALIEPLRQRASILLGRPTPWPSP